MQIEWQPFKWFIQAHLPPKWYASSVLFELQTLFMAFRVRCVSINFLSFTHVRSFLYIFCIMERKGYISPKWYIPHHLSQPFELKWSSTFVDAPWICIDNQRFRMDFVSWNASGTYHSSGMDHFTQAMSFNVFLWFVMASLTPQIFFYTIQAVHTTEVAHINRTVHITSPKQTMRFQPFSLIGIDSHWYSLFCLLSSLISITIIWTRFDKLFNEFALASLCVFDFACMVNECLWLSLCLQMPLKWYIPLHPRKRCDVPLFISLNLNRF